MKHGKTMGIAVCGCLVAGLVGAGCQEPPSQSKGIPDALRAQFADPPNEYRLLQYQLNAETLEKYPPYGIGAFMGFFYKELYQSGAEGAAQIGPLVDAAQERGMKIWLADDFGYPSGMAGGKVVEENPAYEVRGLAMVAVDGAGTGPAACDLPDGAERFAGAVLYPLVDGAPDLSRGKVLPVQERRVEASGMEGPWRLCAFATVIRNQNVQAQSTAAQFKHTGRYPDLMNPDAIARFIAHMHAPIAAQINDLPAKVEGFYSNEPNLMQVHWSLTDSPFACMPWTAALPGQFKRMHGYDLMPKLAALYAGDGTQARRVRMHFQQTVAELLSKNFAGQLREWCNARGIHSSGHFLLDEHLCMHVANYGDYMKFVAEFDVPALDTAVPNPAEFDAFHYEFARFTTSVAVWKKRDATLCLLDPIIGGYGLLRLSPAMPLLLNSVNMMFFNGVNGFSSYTPLDPVDREDAKGRATKATGYTPEEYRAFNEYVGRIGSVLQGARRDVSVALYYPIAMFQADYRPSNQHWTKILPLYEKRQNAWDNTEKALLDGGIEYTIVHPEAVAAADISGGAMNIGSGTFRYLVMPQMEMVPLAVLEKLRAFEAGGGTVLWVDAKPSAGAYPAEDAEVRRLLAAAATVAAGELPGRIGRPFDDSFGLVFEPGLKDLPVARFQKDGRRIYYLVNRKGETLTARIAAKRAGKITLLDPVTGAITEADLPAQVEINAYASLLVVE